MFIFQRNVCLSFSLAQDVEKKPLKLKYRAYAEKKGVPLLNAAAAGLRRNFKLSKLKVRLTFTVC